MQTSLVTLFGPGAVVVEAQTTLVDADLFPEERAYLANAAPARRSEFGTARVCARRALARLGIGPTPLVPRSDRAPVWPTGVVGSITHTSSYCAVVLHRSPPMHSVGVDAESLQRVEPSVRELILLPAERAWIATRDASRCDDLSLLLFSAKEAYYKCQYPVTGVTLGFRDVQIEIDESARHFRAIASAAQ
jgi:4'-phosphopantetheinyl transferase EntD